MLVDFSHVHRDGMIVGGDLRPPVFRQRQTGHAVAGVAILVTEFELASHVGTHVDAPRHFDPAGPAIDELPLEAFCGPAVLSQVTNDPGEPITRADIEQGGPAPEPGDIVIVKTGWGRHYAAATEELYRDYPHLDEQAAHWLVSTGVKLLATDTMSPDLPACRRPAGYTLPVHHILLGAGVLIAENLNLERAEPGRYEVFAFPLAIVSGDGAPARIVGRRLSLTP
ncbi:MAG TPA: cyclase family protein [Streptosporangiaceae bacterium]|jgi:kynurenine formamidase